MSRTFTHPDVFTRGVAEGWADPETDPTRKDWPALQACAVIPFRVVNGRPISPGPPTGIRYGRNELGHWGEQQCADAIVTAHTETGWKLVMVERADGNGWALPGGYVEPGEDPGAAALRELREETGLRPGAVPYYVRPARYVPDPRASDEAWMVTVPVRTYLGSMMDADLPALTGLDDARRAEWVHADTYQALAADLDRRFSGRVFAAHRQLLDDELARIG